ncbi:MAG: hypothetical protein LBR87_01900 [Synergistaceae bacterium]|jgi:hypothetical protein|nr:hypothetical protein [Synergistaceae bacterium]
MKRNCRILLAAALIFGLAARSDAADPQKEVQKLLEPRTSVSWYDVDMLEDIALNARGKLTFTYVDPKLGKAMERLREAEIKNGPFSGISQNVFAYAAKYNGRKKHVVFIARVQAPKLWDFDSSKISVGGYSPAERDIITGVSANPFIELRHGVTPLKRGYDGFIGFFVPAEYVKAGEMIKIGFEDYLTDWKVPSKNE